MEAETDPFDWDVSQVIKALTQPGSPWEKQPETITQKIKEEDIDGETLLTFEQTCPREELYPCLGIHRARQKVWFEKELIRLRARSPQYRKWTREFKDLKAYGEGNLSSPEPKSRDTLLLPLGGQKQESPSLPALSLSRTGTVPLPTPTPSRLTPQTINAELQVENAAPTGNSGLQVVDVIMTENPNVGIPAIATAPEPEAVNIANTEVPQPQAESSAPAQNSQPLVEGVANDHNQLQDAESLEIAQATDNGDDLEPPRKKKKLAPTNITQTPLHKAAHDSQPWENSSPQAYLGEGALSPYMIKSPFVRVSTKLLNKPEGGFTVYRNNHLPPGRRLAVNRTIKQILRKNGRKEELLREGAPDVRDSTPSDDEEDDLIDLENLPDLDEATLREIAEEEKSIEEAKRLQRRMLSDEEIQAALDEAIENMSQRWRDTKRPRYERKAYKHWQDARKRDNSVRERIEKHQQRAAYYDQRIKKISTEIRTESWSKKEDIIKQAQSLEQSLDDKLHNLWLAGILGDTFPPPRPELLPRPAPRPQPQEQDPMDEVLVSTDEESDFVVSDADGGGSALAQDGNMSGTQEPITPIKLEEPFMVDLTQPETDKIAKSRTVIDLTSPSKPPRPSQPRENGENQLPDPPSVGVIDMETIAAFPKSHWSKEDDRWRLAIYILLKLPFIQRAAVLDLIKNESDDNIWSNTIVSYTSKEAMSREQMESSPQDLRDFNLSRVFLSFIKCKTLRSKRMNPLNEKDKKKILDSRLIFDPLCEFIRSIIHLFPKESQIYRRDEIDEEVQAEDDEIETLQNGDLGRETPSRARKSGAKEIVRNKDAVDLRERQNQMIKDQEQRRAKLRNALATSGIVPRDKSRLIINETKDENQSLIYINEDIGTRIKEHQIDGVRFLWNQIIQDPTVRQGCLLAHTMGLGKTMQVITFLVAIAEAIASPDPTIQSQIPADLRSSQTLILCPSGLVNNWVDELLTWAPAEVLGELTKMDSTVAERDRQPTIENWAANGGVLVIGYDMFKNIYDANSEIEAILSSKPNVVVADEAHKLKNPDTKLSKACTNFRTNSRIALTGSPLANNVEEYYSMIDWVAPNFLGPLAEFRAVYGREIEVGLWKDSTQFEKKRAMKMLQVLKETVAPKVNRATIKTCLANDLPPKTEYVISVAPTPLQRKLYDKYLEYKHGSVDSITQSQMFSTIGDLGLICNHPRCFREKVLRVKKGESAPGEAEDNKSFPRTIIPFALRETTVGDKNDPALSMKVELLNIILDEARAQGDKVLIFSHSILTLDYLLNIFQLAKRRVSRLDGKTNPKERQGDTKAFNEGDKEVYLISTTAGGVGLNIQGANRVVLFDTKWNPVDNQQAVGRAYRLGQKKKVFVYHFLVAGSYEDNMQNKAVFKQQLAHRVVDKKNPLNWSVRHANLIHTIKDVERKSLAEFQGQDAILDRLISHSVPTIPEGPVCKIVSADTFEEEDTVIVLTDAERREAEDMVSMNRLRQTDPAEYERRKVEQQYRALQTGQPSSSQPSMQSRGGAHFSSTQPQGRSHQFSSTQPQGGTHQYSSTQPHGGAQQFNQQQGQTAVHQSQAGTVTRTEPAVSSQNISQQPTIVPAVPPFHHQAPVPLPILGANTYLGKPQAPLASKPHDVQAPKPHDVQAPKPPVNQNSRPLTFKNMTVPPGVMQGGIFSQPKTSDKEAFRDGLIEATNSLHSQGKLPTTVPKQRVEAICSSIDEFRINEGFGFLPDNQHWKQLKGLLENDRFVLATISGQLSCKFLALAAKSDLELRVDTLSRLSEAEFGTQMERSTKTPDPQNLRNIGRGSSQKDLEGVGNKDFKIMREAADNRRKPNHSQPWASDALPGNTGQPSQQYTQ